MNDDRHNWREFDRLRINVKNPLEVMYWTKVLGVTPQQLSDAIKVAGGRVYDVRWHLGKR